MATKVSATQQLFAQWGMKYFAAHVGAKSVTPAVLQAWVDKEERRHDPMQQEWANNAAAEEWAIDADMKRLMAMEAEAEANAIAQEEFESLPWDPRLTVK